MLRWSGRASELGRKLLQGRGGRRGRPENALGGPTQDGSKPERDAEGKEEHARADLLEAGLVFGHGEKRDGEEETNLNLIKVLIKQSFVSGSYAVPGLAGSSGARLHHHG